MSISFPSVTGKVQNSCEKTYIIYVLWAILRCVIDALSNLVHAGEIRSESALTIIAFYRV